MTLTCLLLRLLLGRIDRTSSTAIPIIVPAKGLFNHDSQLLEYVQLTSTISLLQRHPDLWYCCSFHILLTLHNYTLSLIVAFTGN